MSEQQLPPVRFDVVDRDGLRVHTCVAPEAFLANSTHIIETPHALVIVDGQFVVPYARAFRDYADRLGKPIERAYLSHSHVDHFFGISAAFGDVPVYAAAQTIEELTASGESVRAERSRQYGPLVPDHVVIPQHRAVPGVEVIDGVKYEIDVVAHAESDAQLLLTLPDFGIAAVQDLVYSGTHVYVTRDSATWITVLRGLIDSDADVFLAGHGGVADRAELQRNIDYLTYAGQTYERTTDPAAFKAAMLARFPDRGAAALLDIDVPRLYGQAGE